MRIISYYVLAKVVELRGLLGTVTFLRETAKEKPNVSREGVQSDLRDVQRHSYLLLGGIVAGEMSMQSSTLRLTHSSLKKAATQLTQAPMASEIRVRVEPLASGLAPLRAIPAQETDLAGKGIY
jgi:hypothetical protein